MRWFILATLLFGCTNTTPIEKEPTVDQLKKADTVLAGVLRIMAENKQLQQQVAQLKKQVKKTPRELCMDDLGFKNDSQDAPLYVCSEPDDFVIVPLHGRYLLARGLGCGETFEDSFLLFKTRKDINDYIDAVLCAQKEQK